jgi:hypothetical protein
MNSRAAGRPPIPADLRALMGTTATASPTWGEERIAAELPLKRGIRISPRSAVHAVETNAPTDGRETTRPFGGAHSRISTCGLNQIHFPHLQA